jgi:colanic acid/amylovoran biosynthesis glycosyltransferase
VRSRERGAILYVVSRFPRVSETFVVNEWWELAERFPLELAALLRGEQEVVHPAAARLLPRVQFLAVASPATAISNAATLVRSPGRYALTLAQVLRGSFRRPAGGALKGAAVFWESVHLARIARRLGVVHVHAHFLHHPATAAWVVHRIAGTSFSVTAHADDLFIGPALFHEKLRDARFVATISEYNRAYLADAAPGEGHVEIVRCGVRPEDYTFRERTAVRRLVCVARLERKKGHATLLRAFALVAKEAPGLTLDLAGDGAEHENLESLARELRLDGRVRFHGALPATAVRDLLQEADAFVLAAMQDPVGSLQTGKLDGIPVALMEAMACGLPVVTTSLSGIPELVQHGVTGLVVAPEDPPAVAGAIRRLLAEPDLAAKLGRDAREQVSAHFNLAVESAKLGELFSRALASA